MACPEGVDIKLCVHPSQHREEKEQAPRKEVKTETLFVNAQEVSYAELLQSMKSKVDVQGLGVKVSNLRKTNSRGNSCLE